jgi:hypothetical protein
MRGSVARSDFIIESAARDTLRMTRSPARGGLTWSQRDQ